MLPLFDTAVSLVTPTTLIDTLAKKSLRPLWYVWIGHVGTHEVRLKFFGRYAQVLDIDQVRYGGTEYKTQKAMKTDLQGIFDRLALHDKSLLA
jgi:hypothetical protein